MSYFDEAEHKTEAQQKKVDQQHEHCRYVKNLTRSYQKFNTWSFYHLTCLVGEESEDFQDASMGPVDVSFVPLQHAESNT